MNLTWNLILKLQDHVKNFKLLVKVENLLEKEDLILEVIDLKVN